MGVKIWVESIRDLDFLIGVLTNIEGLTMLGNSLAFLVCDLVLIINKDWKKWILKGLILSSNLYQEISSFIQAESSSSYKDHA